LPSGLSKNFLLEPNVYLKLNYRFEFLVKKGLTINYLMNSYYPLLEFIKINFF